ncbi:MAG: pyroglutamyl-peptidase I [Bacilli bacterium]
MKILITGFDVFKGLDINPSYEAIKCLPKIIDNKEIIVMKLPVVFDECYKELEKVIKKEKPDYVINIGVATSRNEISIESSAKNIKKSNIKDNSGNIFLNESKIINNADEILKTSIDINKILLELKGYKIPSYISNDAGSYVCNNVYFYSLYNEKQYGYKALFIHVPGINSMDIQMMNKAIKIIIRTL